MVKKKSPHLGGVWAFFVRFLFVVHQPTPATMVPVIIMVVVFMLMTLCIAILLLCL